MTRRRALPPTPIAPDHDAVSLLAGPQELARWIRAITGIDTVLRYRASEGGWWTLRGEFVGRNVPTIRAAIEGHVVVGDSIFLIDRSDVSERTCLDDIAEARRAIDRLTNAAQLRDAAAPRRRLTEVC